jgi:hypothetical protein
MDIHRVSFPGIDLSGMSTLGVGAQVVFFLGTLVANLIFELNTTRVLCFFY